MIAVAKPKPPPVIAADDADAEIAPADFPLAAPLRLNLSALGIDRHAPDFGERLFRMANDNQPYTFEYSAQGELIVMPPSGWESNIGENETNISVGLWRRENGGYAASQTVQFRLPSGAVYIPDAAWITQERYDALRAGDYASTIPGAPDFVVEVRSRTDNLATGLVKMEEWMDGGARLGWHIDPYARRVHIYRSGRGVEILENPQTLSGEDILPGFVFEVASLVFDRY